MVTRGLLLLLALSGCGPLPKGIPSATGSAAASCAGLHTGRYGRLPVATEIIDLREDCSGEFLQDGQTFPLTYRLQGSTAHYTLADGRSWACAYTATGLTLTLNCGAGSIQYGLNAF